MKGNWIFAIVCILIGAFLLWYFYPPPDPPKPPDKGAVEIPKTGNITIGSDEQPALPADYTPKPGDKIITVTAKQDIKAGEKVKILVPTADRPYVLGDSGRAVIGQDSSKVEVTYEEFKEPWFHLTPHILAGASINKYLEPSPIVGVTVLTLFGKAHLGAAADRFGAGPMVGYEILARLDAVMKYNVLDWHDRPAQFSIGVAYVF